LEHILAEFGPELRRRSDSDRLIRATGVSDFVITVLVPELAVMLVKEDMKVCDKTARQVLQESASLGETLHEDI
jgi:RTC4-like domain